MILIVSWAFENNLVYFEICSGWSMIVIVFWAVENNLVYIRPILVGPVIVIESWAIENNIRILTIVYLRCFSGWAYDSDRFLGY